MPLRLVYTLATILAIVFLLTALATTIGYHP